MNRIHATRAASPGRGWTTAALVLAVALTGLTAPGIAAPRGPALVFEPSSLDFGRMNQHETRSAEVTLTNEGDEVLMITKVEPSCGCTVAELPRDVLKPGESMVLPVTFDSRSFSGDQHKLISVYTNDPENPVLEIPIEATVLVPLMIDPPRKQLGFGRVRRGEVKTEEATFTAMMAPEITVTPVRWDRSVFDVEVRHDYEGDPQRELVLVSTKPDAPLGDHRDFLTVRTDLPEAPTVDLELFATVVQDVAVFPDRINFRYVMRGKEMVNKVRVYASDPTVEFKVTGAEIDLPDFTTSVETTKPGKEFVVHIEGTPLPMSDERVQAAKGRMSGTLTIFTDLPQVPELKVQVVYLLRV